MPAMIKLAIAATAALICASVSDAQMMAGSSGSGATTSVAGASDMIQNGGIGVQILFVGFNKAQKQITVSAQITNLNNEKIHVALIGPEPAAIDTRGVQYQLINIAGIPRCNFLGYDDISNCLSNENNLPNTSFSQLDAGARALAAMTFRADEPSTSGFMSIALAFAVVTGDVVDADTRAAVRNVPITFPMVDLASAQQ